MSDDGHQMTRDARDVWPNSVPIGTFDIEAGTVENHPAATAHLTFVCPNKQRCTVLVGPEGAPRATPEHYYVWKWDGDLERPTLTPSINCLAEKDGEPAGGCGWHGHITQGVIK